MIFTENHKDHEKVSYHRELGLVWLNIKFHSKLTTVFVKFEFIQEYNAKIHSKPAEVKFKKVSVIFEFFLAQFALGFDPGRECITLLNGAIVRSTCESRNSRNLLTTDLFPKNSQRSAFSQLYPT